MGLIIKNKIAQLKKGYPTVSDKYNVQGGIYEGDDALHFGDLLAYGSATGHYVKLAATDTVDKLAGICLATNVKLANKYPGDSNASVETLKGEAFNLLVRGFIAVKVKAADYKTAYEDYVDDPTEAHKTALEAAKTAVANKFVEGADAALALDGEEVVFDVATDDALQGVYFMSVVEFVGDEVIAELNYRM
jgi:hypothetical protein